MWQLLSRLAETMASADGEGLTYGCFFFQAEDGIRDAQESRGLGDVYKRQIDRGSSPRHARPNQRFSSEALARNRLSTILRNGVEGKALR